MSNDETRMATDKQVSYCKALFRKTKLYYKTLSDEPSSDLVHEGRSPFVHEVLVRTGFNLDVLTADQASAVIGKLKKELAAQRR
jgi:hypothetical protein